MFITEYAKKFIGRQETAGPNRGPLVDKWKAAISTFLAPKPIPWCACFGYAMLAEVSGLTKKAIAKELGFVADTWYPESTHSWLDQAVLAGRTTSRPVRGDFFLLLKPNGQGGFVAGQPHHLGILDQDGCPAVGSQMLTVEGNTIPGHLDGTLSREGDGVYARTRTVQRGEFVFISIPGSLKQQPEAREETPAPAPLQSPAAPAEASAVAPAPRKSAQA
jgi:hypothetical protein